MIWRIFHFKERYELPDDMKSLRKSGLHYTKRFVGVAGGDEAVGYQSQFGMLQNGDGLEACMLEGIYGRLVNMAAQHSKAKRGFLLDAADQPLTDGQIGKLLNINARTMSKYLRLFETVKLLEKVDKPEFDMSLNEQPAKKKGGDNSDYRKTSGISEKTEAPLKKRQTAKPPNGGKGKGKQRATNGLTAVNEKENINGNSAKHKANVQGRVGPQGKVKDEPPSAPTTTPPLPLKPQVSDDLGGSKVIPFTAPQTSLKPASGRGRAVMATGAGDYDRSDELFGQRVYVALGYRYEISSPEGRREICSFASKWAQARSSLARLSPELCDDLGVRLLEEARKIGRRGKRNKRPGAVWCTVADKLVDARLREAM